MTPATALTSGGRLTARGAAHKADSSFTAVGSKDLVFKDAANETFKGLGPDTNAHGFITPPVDPQSRTVLYLFSGTSRANGLACHLRSKGLSKDLVLRIIEADVCRNADRNLLNHYLQMAILSDNEGCLVDVLAISPPCGTWSRAMFNNLSKPCNLGCMAFFLF